MKASIALFAFFAGCVNTLTHGIEPSEALEEYENRLMCEPLNPLPSALGDGESTFGECIPNNEGERVTNSNNYPHNQVVVECQCDDAACCRWSLQTQLCCFGNECLWVHGNVDCDK